MKRWTMNKILPVLAGAAAGGLIAWAVAGGSGNNETTTVIQQTRGGVPTSLSASRGMTVNRVYRQVGSGVVDITVTARSDTGGFGFFGGSQQTQGEGSGVVYDKKGDILTDEHVVAGATSVKVTFEDGTKVPAKVLGTDPSTDVGVIRVNVPESRLHPIPFSDSSSVQVGDPVVAIGSPFSLPETVTAGIVSAVGRSITAPNNYTITGAIQTDAAINPGNSGGPLLDGNGHVLGLNDQIQTNSGSNAGVGFAIPSNMVAHIAGQIMAGHKVKHAYVGVFLNGASLGGAEVTSVQPGSPADNAGLRPNDVVIAINGKRIGSTQQFIETVDTFSPGQIINVTVKRHGSTKQLKLQLGSRPSTQPSG
ncbi:MAG: S1C family serine protease [Solirubrobacteraceae bacterium]